MSKKKYQEIGMHYANCLMKHGDSHFGVDWPTEEGAIRRYDVMIEFIMQSIGKDRVKVLDFGCGLSGLWERIIKLKLEGSVDYWGIDIIQEYVDVSRQKFPDNNYRCIDILAENAPKIGEYDYVLLNGLFTQKMSLDNEEMLSFLGDVLVTLFKHTRVGIQFNCMSPLVDFKKDGAFHLDFDTLSSFITAKLSRKFLIRHDIFPYEYFCIIYK